MKYFSIIFLIFSNATAMQTSFDDGKQEALLKNEEIEEKIKSENPTNSVPQFREGFQINQDELGKTFENLEKSEYGKDLAEIHKNRKPFKNRSTKNP